VTADPYALTTHDGKTVDEITHQALLACEKRLGYELTVVQGSYQALDGRANDVAASAGTHDAGGVVDLDAWDWERKVRVLRAVGFAAWHRTPDQGPWGEHIHAVLIGNKNLAPSAARQVEAYRAHRDGLKSNLPDDTWHPDPIPTFVWPVPMTRGKNVDEAIADARAAKQAADAKGQSRRVAILKAALDSLRSLPVWRKR
jgi:hypothetical protein